MQNHINYALGVFNGVPDNSLSDTSVSSHRDFAARLFFNPLNSEGPNLGFGIGASSGKRGRRGVPSYKTFAQNTFFTFSSGVIEAGHRTRLAPGAYYYMGGFGLYSEYGLARKTCKKGRTASISASAPTRWPGATSSPARREVYGVPRPAEFRSQERRLGRMGTGARHRRVHGPIVLCSATDFVSATAGPRLTHEVVGGVNWYLNRLVRISGDYGRTNFGGGETVAQGIQPAHRESHYLPISNQLH